MSKQKNQDAFDNSFYRLAGEVTKALEKNKDGKIQQTQVEELMQYEDQFKKAIFIYRQSDEIYKMFLQKIRIQNKNILSARPYFREKSVIFSKQITPAIKAEDIEKLKTFHVNFQFIEFVKRSWRGPFPTKAKQIYEKVRTSRNRLIEDNMPLAINRAKLFYRKTPKSHLTLMDMIGICSMGLAAGVDKWCGPYSPVFRSVCIGRMVGNLIDSYSETMLHFYPSDKRILYKAHTLRSRKQIDDINNLVEAVKTGFIEDAAEGKSVPKTKIDASELSSLMNAASTVSADAGSYSDDGQLSETSQGGTYGVYQFTPDDKQNTEESYIQQENMSSMVELSKKLPILNRKLLRLKGIEI